VSTTGEQGTDARSSATLGYAQMYINRGWPLLVCHPRSKEPLGELVPHGVKDATTDIDVIARWLESHPDANLAVACGAPGPQVLDIDDPGSVPTGVAGAVMKAPRTRSARGGAGFFQGTDASTINLDWGELRGQGSYQLVPPSIHPSGKTYVWLQEPRGKLPTAPDLASSAKTPLGTGPAPDVPSIPPEGGMHEHLTDLAVRLVRAGVQSQETITTALLAEFEVRRSAPASAYGGGEHDTHRIAEWACGTRIAERERERPGTEQKPAEPSAAISRIVDMREAIRLGNQPLPYRFGLIAVDGFVTVLAGRRGENKSWLAQFACHAVHRDETTWPFAHRAGRALYLDAEGGLRLMGRRFVQTGMDEDAFVVADGTGLHLPRDIDEVGELVEHVSANLLVLDTLRRLAPKMRENDSDDAAPVMAALAGLSRKTNCAVVTIHHRSIKWGAADTRGSSAIEDQADIVFVLEKVEGDPDMATRRRLRCTKMRVDREPGPLWLQFKKTAGFMTMSEAEPFERSADEPRAHEALADRIREMAGEVNGGMSPADLAKRLGCDREGRPFKDAVRLLIESGEWEATGSTRSRRLHPRFDSEHPPYIGNVPNRIKDAEAAEQLFERYDQSVDGEER
jgi:hypothetical protein